MLSGQSSDMERGTPRQTVETLLPEATRAERKPHEVISSAPRARGALVKMQAPRPHQGDSARRGSQKHAVLTRAPGISHTDGL